MVHTQRDISSFLNFIHSMYSYYFSSKSEFIGSLLDIKTAITDDDPALHGAFKSVLAETEFLLCCNHLRKDIAKILPQFSVKEHESEEILIEIFGTVESRKKSLIGSSSLDEYESRLQSLLTKWQKLTRKCEKISTFSSWFVRFKSKKNL